jgi:SAM-dependent methyltransferase
MRRFVSFDQPGYRTLPACEGYSRWAATYEDTIKYDIDTWLLEDLETVAWSNVERCADLGCGTGRTAAWLTSKGVRVIDGIDGSPEMLERARVQNVFASLNLADVADTRLPDATYDLVITCLVDEHLAELGPLYAEAARIARDGAAFVVVGRHPFFIMAAAAPTQFKGSDGEAVVIETYVHLFSNHAKAAFAGGWQLTEFREHVIDDHWVKIRPTSEACRDIPISFGCVWRR